MKRNFYFKLLIYTSLVALLPILIISFILYRNTTQVMQKELQTTNEAYLKQTANAMELIIRQITNSFQQTVLDGTIKEFEIFTLGSYYESLTGDYNTDDLRNLHMYLNSKSKAQWYLDVLRNSNEFIQSVYFYDNAKNIVLTGGMQYKKDSFHDNDWSLSTEGIHVYPAISEIREARQKEGNFKQVISVIYPTPTTNNYIAVNLDVEKLCSDIFQKFFRDGNHTVFVLSESGQLMFNDRGNEINVTISKHPVLQRNIKEGAQHSYEVELSGNRSFVTQMNSELLGWTFISAIAIDDLYVSVTKIKKLITFTAVLLIAATALLVFVTSRNIYNPIFHLLSFIKRNNDDTGEYPQRNRSIGELKLIHSSLQEAFEERTNLQARLQESLPAYKKMFIHSLLRNNTLSREEIAERMRMLNVRIELEGLLLMVVSVKEREVMDVERIHLNKLRIADIIDANIPAGNNRIVTELIDELFVVIINCDPSQLTAMFGLADRIVQDIKTLPGINGTIGIGGYCHQLRDLPKVFEQAKEALRYRIVSGDMDVIYIEDARLKDIPVLDYPRDKEIALNSYVVNGEAEQAKHMLAEMVKDIKAQHHKVDFRQVQQAFIRLLGSLMESASGLRLDINKVLQRQTNLYDALLRKDEVEDIRIWFDDIIVQLTTYIGKAFVDKNNKYVQQAIHLLTKEFHDNISLASVAEQLQLSPSYLSRIFKEHTGQSFSDYAMAARVEYAKKLLIETNLMIKEIGQRIGYHTTNYFIRVFKEVTGVTPGEYRKMHETKNTTRE